MFKIKNIKKSKLAAVAIGTAVKVITTVVCGALLLTGTYGVVKHTVLPTSTAKTKSMFAYGGGADTDEDVGGSGGSGGSVGDNPVYETETKVIPVGAKYTKADGTVLEGNGTNKFPVAPAESDAYEEGDYIYTCINSGTEWSVVTKNKTKSSYGKIMSEIAGEPVSDMYRTFYECSSLTSSPKIPNSVTNMDGTFSGCTSLSTAPVIPDGVINMNSAFYRCESLIVAPTIPDGVTDISYMFSGCTSLKTYAGNTNSDGNFSSYKLPSRITDMFQTFMYCSSLTIAPIIPDSVTDMYGTFDGCISLTTAPIIPNGVTNMTNTFTGCTSLVIAPTIPNSVTDMTGTFNSCEFLTTVPTIPSGVMNMFGTFQECPSLTGTITINANPDNYYKCFWGTQKSIILTGSSSTLTELAATATNGNVTVK